METKNHILEAENEVIKLEGKIRGFKQGFLDGFKDGFEDGIKQGKIKKEEEFIRNMLAEDCSIEFISKISNRH